MNIPTDTRVERLRNSMEAQDLDALIIRDVRDLRWITGFEHVFDSEEAHTALVTRDALIIHTDSRYASAMRAAAESGGKWVVDSEVEQAGPFAARILDTLGIANMHKGNAPRIGIDAAISLSLFRSFEAALENMQLVELKSIPLELRALKDENERIALEHAQKIAESAFLDVVDSLSAGQSEHEIALALDYAMRTHGADGNSFSTIVASGPNGANPHAIPSDRRVQNGDLVVFDFGAMLDGYCSDTTRVICIGSPSAEQQHAYDAVRRANETVEAHLRPGVTGKEMHELALSVLDDEGFGGLMGHGLGHGVGLAIHELPNLNPRNDSPLEEGNVITVEPGVYLDGRFGIRLEDCGIITASGFESFCSLPHDLLCVGSGC